MKQISMFVVFVVIFLTSSIATVGYYEKEVVKYKDTIKIYEKYFTAQTLKNRIDIEKSMADFKASLNSECEEERATVPLSRPEGESECEYKYRFIANYGYVGWTIWGYMPGDVGSLMLKRCKYENNLQDN